MLMKKRKVLSRRREITIVYFTSIIILKNFYQKNIVLGYIIGEPNNLLWINALFWKNIK